MSDIDHICRAARTAALALAPLGEEARNRALAATAHAIEANAREILDANERDVSDARPLVESGEMSAPLLRRLELSARKVAQIAEGVRAVAALPDPVGVARMATLLDEDLTLRRVTCPLGVVAAVFESRPDALVQIASLCLKSGNAAILKGGREAAHTNRCLADLVRRAASSAGEVPADALQLVEAREEVQALLARDDAVDLLIPRGSNEFVRYIKEHSSIPVLGHADGVCHLYVDESADEAMAVRIAVDAKTQYPAVCNAIETLLVHEARAQTCLPALAGALGAKGVSIRGCAATCAILPDAQAASEEDWGTEYLDTVISVRVVESLGAAIDHVNRYGSRHTEAIVARDEAAARTFLARVDAASVMWNASTRLADGFRYGLGAEVGIATDKIHARGPVGLEGLVTYKYHLTGNGHLVSDYEGEGARAFLHKPLPLSE